MDRRRYDYEPIDPLWRGIGYALLFAAPFWGAVITWVL